MSRWAHYNGAAQLVSAGRAPIQVSADLCCHANGVTWFGDLLALRPQGERVAQLVGHTAQLRLPSGRYGEVLLRSSYLAAEALIVNVGGQDAPPFGPLSDYLDAVVELWCARTAAEADLAELARRLQEEA